MASWLQALEVVLDSGLPATNEVINKTAERMSGQTDTTKVYKTRQEYLAEQQAKQNQLTQHSV